VENYQSFSAHVRKESFYSFIFEISKKTRQPRFNIMRVFKFFVSLFITIGLIYLLDKRWVIKGSPLPPIGKFIDPFNGFWRNIDADDATLP
jgi:hypothetical protein